MSRSVLILDDDYDLRTTLADALRLTCKVDTVTARDVPAMVALGDRALRCSLAFIDVNLGADQPSGLDAYRWLIDNGFTGRVVFLTGHARVLSAIQETVKSGAADVVQKPASLKTLQSFIESTPG